jgi:hypothetical protein
MQFWALKAISRFTFTEMLLRLLSATAHGSLPEIQI